jgi:hypothetical protein
MQPDEQIVKSGPNTNGKEIMVAATEDKSLLVTYSPYGMDFQLDLTDLSSERISMSWYSPRNNTYISSKDIELKDIILFDPPSDPGIGNDWILLLETE